MAAGTESYEAPQYGNLAGAIGEKIGSALTMAAQARRKRDGEKQRLSEQIAELNNKEDKTDEEKQQLKDLQQRQSDLNSQGFGFIGKKALAAEFGGDLRRRTKGFFQMDPADQDDPALDKKKRFEALLRAQPVGKQTPPGEAPQAPRAVQDGGILGSFATGIVEKISLLEKKISDLKSVEQKDQTPKTVVTLSKNVSSFRKFFSKNNKIEEEQVKIAQQQLEQQKQEAADAKQARAELAAEGRDRSAGSTDIDNRRDGSTLKGMFGGLLDFGMDMLDLGGRRRRGGGRRGRGGGILGGLFGRRRRGRRGLGGGIRPRTQYTRPIGPQPMNSSTPWARRSPGERGGMYGQGGFTPRLESSPTKMASGGVIKKTPPIKMASGGVLDNPTQIGAGDKAVIPQNKLADAVKTNQENVKKADPFAKVLQLPTMAAGALLMSTVGNVINNMGGVAKLFRPVLTRLFTPAAAAFGLPVNLITAIFGGAPAQASMMVGPPGTGKGNGKTGTGNAVNASTGGNATGISAGGMVSGGGSVGQYRASRGYGMQRHPIHGTQKMHWGIDYAIPEGEPIGLKKGGKVIEVAPPTTGSEVSGIVTVKHDDGTESRYVHLSSVNVSNGETVYPGTLVGKVGGVPGNPGGGGSTGAHLHWEYYRSAGQPADGAGLADSYFTVGGQVTTPTTPPVTPPASPTSTPQTPNPPPAAPQTPTTLPAIVIPRSDDKRAAAALARRSQSSSNGNGGANLPVRNPNAANPATPTP
ncbi:hypothetical protein R1080702_011 [Cyanophage S-RIM32]|uniref:M23ase beta-sheet core domain-containing protein n=1 Tax=Cyanophage S-RIM32 TaxID=1278479 RepID=A0A127KM73_9CAUD|nr:hypothetical protein BJD26_gp011 [Cyanophage S-RIM32]AMO43026.1 hypothetical protein R1080702_011 [Cyanophage S-RIM32]